jgi:hypothetical protein
MSRQPLRFGAAILVLILAGFSHADAVIYDVAAQRELDMTIAGVVTFEQLSEFTGVTAFRCVVASPRSELCEWRMDGRSPGWRSVAGAIRTRDRIALLCELPTDGSPRAANSCSAHPQRSNRNQWEIPPATGRRRQAFGSRSRARVRADYSRAANQALASSQGVVALSRLAGITPDSCNEARPNDRVCTWKTTNHTYGHGTLVMAIKASKRKKIRMRCRLPLDGGPRAPDSCLVEVGA